MQVCNEEMETAKHVIKTCRFTGNEARDWKEVIWGEGKNLAILHEISWKRKRYEAMRYGRKHKKEEVNRVGLKNTCKRKIRTHTIGTQ